jgi:hypothetical protein
MWGRILLARETCETTRIAFRISIDRVGAQNDLVVRDY